MLNNEPFQDDESLGHYYVILASFIKQINDKINKEVETRLRDEIKKVCLIGYYDEQNVREFFKRYDRVKKDFSTNPLSLIRKLIYSKLENWRDNIQQSADNKYEIFNNKNTIKNHTFCEISQRKAIIHEINYALLNHYACAIDTDEISVSIDGGASVKFFNLRCNSSFEQWLNKTIIQKRHFEPYDKHDKKGKGNRSGVSELECSKEEAQDLLNTAIGGFGHKLFNYDKKHKMYIIFMDEKHGECEKTYHGYHVDLNSTDVPTSIVSQLLND